MCSSCDWAWAMSAMYSPRTTREVVDDPSNWLLMLLLGSAIVDFGLKLMSCAERHRSFALETARLAERSWPLKLILPTAATKA